MTNQPVVSALLVTIGIPRGGATGVEGRVSDRDIDLVCRPFLVDGCGLLIICFEGLF